ncbi:MAG TPA: hypothetical protein VG755_42445 [Nannocystaceae bacterium]|nr:hypothetical protein [Nannocystaceae bacterium]
MSTGTRSIAVALFSITLACAASDDDDDGAGDTTSGGPATTTTSSSSSSSGSTNPTTTSPSETNASAESEGSWGESGDDESSGSSSSGGDESSSSESGGAVEYDEEFVWVADFMRTNCVGCHATGMNGNLLLPGPDISNDEVRMAIEGVVATTGLLMVEPGDRNASQTWLQITNEFGAQFPVEDTDRFGAWIDAGAHYVVE